MDRYVDRGRSADASSRALGFLCPDCLQEAIAFLPDRSHPTDVPVLCVRCGAQTEVTLGAYLSRRGLRAAELRAQLRPRSAHEERIGSGQNRETGVLEAARVA